MINQIRYIAGASISLASGIWVLSALPALSQTSSFESFNLAPGFLPDPATGSGISGGDYSTLSDCGFDSDINISVPDHLLTATQPFNYLRISVTSEADVTLIIEDINTGDYRCIDDSNGTLLPEYAGFVAAGTYAIWIGDFDYSQNFYYEIAISEYAPSTGQSAPVVTPPSQGQPAQSTNPGNSSFSQTLLDAHNVYRAQVGVPSLSWSPSLATSAQQWANQLAAQDSGLRHSNTEAGENVAWGTPSAYFSLTDHVDAWAAEQNNNYIPGIPYAQAEAQATGVIGHYTQIVWRNTTEVGCGVAVSASDGEFLVCQYNPPGNFINQVPY